MSITIRPLSPFGAEIIGLDLDDGRAFDPLCAPEADLGVPLEERRVGGLGIHLLRKLASEIRYHREDGRNHLHVVIRPAG